MLFDVKTFLNNAIILNQHLINYFICQPLNVHAKLFAPNHLKSNKCKEKHNNETEKEEHRIKLIDPIDMINTANKNEDEMWIKPLKTIK